MIAHRSVALLIGLLVITQTTVGASLLYAPEYFHFSNRSIFHHTPAQQDISMGAALALVNRTYPQFHAGSVKVDNGIYEVASSDISNPYVYGVDPGAGRITGKANLNGGVPGFLFNLHTCGLTCKGYPGYVEVLSRPVPNFGVDWLKKITYGAAWLATIALTLMFLTLSGAVLGWSGVRRWARGLRSRWSKSSFARRMDLHRLIGLIAVPMLLAWSLTGASFKLHFVDTAWDKISGAKENFDHAAPFASKPAPAGTADIGPDAAIATATRTLPGRPTSLTLPSGKKPGAVYTVRLAVGRDPWRHSLRQGQGVVAVDRHNAARAKVTLLPYGPTLANTAWDRWRAPALHFGYAVNGWWRLFWLAFGLSPLILAILGVSTWLRRRANKRARAASRPAAQTAG